jgi:hypothetical protein
MLHNAITLAKKLKASLRLVYIVDFEDIKVLAPGPPDGGIRRRLLRGSATEAQFVAEGRDREREFAALCKGASIKCSSDVFVGPSEAIWAEEGRSCDLIMILPVEKDFGRFERWFGSMFWRIAVRSCRPVLIVRQDGLPESRMALFYSNEVQSAGALPWVCRLHFILGMSLTIYVGELPSREYARDDECQMLLDRHDLPARFEEKNALAALDAEVNQPGSELHEPSLLVFDRGFYIRPWFRKRRRLVERLIHTSPHSILLCP